MKKVFLYAALAAWLVLAVGSCNKNDGPSADVMEEVVFRAGGPAFEADIQTKADPVTGTNLTGFNVIAATGTAGSAETEAWSTAYTKDGNVFKGGKYWPSDNPNYHFWAANAAMSMSASGPSISVPAETDVIVAYKAKDDVGFRTVNTLSFEHVYARIGECTVSAATGYTLSNVSITVTPKVSGTFSLFAGVGKTDETGWSNTTAGSAVGIANPNGGTKANDVWLVSGQYELTASWTATQGDFSQTYSNKVKTVSIVRGKVNKITTTLGGDADEIEFNITVADWEDHEIPVSFDM